MTEENTSNLLPHPMHLLYMYNMADRVGSTMFLHLKLGFVMTLCAFDNMLICLDIVFLMN